MVTVHSNEYGIHGCSIIETFKRRFAVGLRFNNRFNSAAATKCIDTLVVDDAKQPLSIARDIVEPSNVAHN